MLVLNIDHSFHLEQLLHRHYHNIINVVRHLKNLKFLLFRSNRKSLMNLPFH